MREKSPLLSVEGNITLMDTKKKDVNEIMK